MQSKTENHEPSLRPYPAQPHRSEQPLNLQITYRGVIARLAAHRDAEMFQAPRHLPELSHAELGAVLTHYPEILAEAVAENDVGLRCAVVQSLTKSASPTHRYSLVGLEVIEAMRRYCLPLVLRDVQEQVEVNRECAWMDLQRATSC